MLQIVWKLSISAVILETFKFKNKKCTQYLELNHTCDVGVKHILQFFGSEFVTFTAWMCQHIDLSLTDNKIYQPTDILSSHNNTMDNATTKTPNLSKIGFQNTPIRGGHALLTGHNSLSSTQLKILIDNHYKTVCGSVGRLVGQKCVLFLHSGTAP